MFRANRISNDIFFVSLVLGIFAILVIFASWLKRIAARGELRTVKSIDKETLNTRYIYGLLPNSSGGRGEVHFQQPFHFIMFAFYKGLI